MQCWSTTQRLQPRPQPPVLVTLPVLGPEASAPPAAPRIRLAGSLARSDAGSTRDPTATGLTVPRTSPTLTSLPCAREEPRTKWRRSRATRTI